jgi:HK97 family phage portal protein
MRNPLAVAVSRMRAPASSGGGALVPSYTDKQPQWSQWSTKNAIQDGFKSSAWVYKCVERLMKASASVPWNVYELQAGEWVEIEGHPLADLMRRPNPFMGQQKLMEWMTAQLYLAGNSVLSKVVVGGKVRELWPIWELDKIQVVPSRENFIDRYDFRRDGNAIRLDPSEVVHLMFPDPSTPFWGISPLQAVGRVVDSDTEAVRWNKVMLQNRGRPDGVFVIPGQVGRTQLDEARAIVTEQYGGSENRGVPFVFGSGMNYTPMSMTPAEMDWLESRKLTRQEICAVFGVPLPMVGIYDDATLANIDTARRIFWADTVIPFLDDVKESLNMSVTPHFGDPAKLQLRYDTSNVEALREDLTAKISQLKTLTSVGVPLNVAIQRLDLGIDPVDGGDVSLVPATMIPMADAGQSDPQAPKPADMAAL